ncbi:MAG: VWA domain-containing protein [Candidatus Obscuribacterales bacterium]|nr:VWA domain-containing protein [Candidatus Obscuribacterales bacterium]
MFHDRKTISILALVCLVASLQAPADAAKKKAPTDDMPIIELKALIPKLDKLPPPKVLHGSIDQNVNVPQLGQESGVYSKFGYYRDKSGPPTGVTGLRLGSPAYKKGLQVGDRILVNDMTDHKAIMVIERDGKKYVCILDMADWETAKSQQKDNSPQSANAVASNKDGDAGLSKPAAEILANHNIVLLVDNSASMGTRDCGNLSRWEWCQGQTSNMYKEAERAVGDKLSIVIFNSNYRSYQQCTLARVADVFRQNTPTGESFMAPAITDALSSVRGKLSYGQPAVIAIITDGRPSDADQVKKLVINATKDIVKPELLTITFVEIGSYFPYLRELDNDLTKQGASSDIVTVFPFWEVNKMGLLRTLAKAVTSPRSAPESAGRKYTPEEVAAWKKAQQEKIDAEKRRAANTVRWGTQGTGQATAKPAQTAAVAKPPVIEVDEKASVRRAEANRTYSFPSSNRRTP